MDKIVNVNVLGNITVTGIEMKTLNKLFADLRDAQKAAEGAEENQNRLLAEQAELKAQLQAAVDAVDTDALSKLNPKMRILLAKLEESPTHKMQTFDNAVNKLTEFFTSRIPGYVAPAPQTEATEKKSAADAMAEAKLTLAKTA